MIIMIEGEQTSRSFLKQVISNQLILQIRKQVQRGLLICPTSQSKQVG